MAAYTRVGGSCAHFKPPEAVRRQKGCSVTLGLRQASDKETARLMGCESCECVKARTEAL